MTQGWGGGSWALPGHRASCTFQGVYVIAVLFPDPRLLGVEGKPGWGPADPGPPLSPQHSQGWSRWEKEREGGLPGERASWGCSRRGKLQAGRGGGVGRRRCGVRPGCSLFKRPARFDPHLQRKLGGPGWLCGWLASAAAAADSGGPSPPRAPGRARRRRLLLPQPRLSLRSLSRSLSSFPCLLLPLPPRRRAPASLRAVPAARRLPRRSLASRAPWAGPPRPPGAPQPTPLRLGPRAGCIFLELSIPLERYPKARARSAVAPAGCPPRDSGTRRLRALPGRRGRSAAGNASPGLGFGTPRGSLSVRSPPPRNPSPGRRPRRPARGELWPAGGSGSGDPQDLGCTGCGWGTPRLRRKGSPATSRAPDRAQRSPLGWLG